MAREGMLKRESGTSREGFKQGIGAEWQSAKSGRVMLLLAALLLIIDYGFGQRYVGFQWVWGMGDNLNVLLNIITSSVFMLICLVYLLTKLANHQLREMGDLPFAFLFGIVLTFFLLNTFWIANLKAVVHFAFILLFGLTFIKEMNGLSSAFLFTSVLLIADFFGYAFLKKFLIFQYIPFLTLFVIIYVYAKTGDNFSFVCLAILTIVAFMLIWSDPAMAGVKGSILGHVPEEYSQITIGDVFRKIGMGFTNVKENVRKQYQARMEYATGGYYSSQVEQNEEEQLGVYIENMLFSQDKYFDDEAVILWADLRAKTLKEPINIKINCTSGKDDALKVGEVKPAELNIATMEEEGLQCKFPKLDAGTRTVKLSAEFNFETMGYLKTYFMDIERMRALRRNEIDPLEQYGITDKAPMAVFTNGPVRIGIGTNDQLPIGLGRDYIQNPRLGITIENQWNGKIKNITGLCIEIPRSMKLEETAEGGFCNGWFERTSRGCLGESFQDDNYAAYKMTAKLKNELNRKPIDTFVSRRCIIEVEDIEDALGTTPVATHYYRSSVAYIYYVENSISVSIAETEKTQMQSCEDSCSDASGCKCINEDCVHYGKTVAYESNCGGTKTTARASAGAPTSLSISINNGASEATTLQATLTLYVENANSCRYSNDGSTWTDWELVKETKEWTLRANDEGASKVYYQCRNFDSYDNEQLSSIISDEIGYKPEK